MQPFQFKQFKVKHHRSSVKVSTDSILLGAWVHITPSYRRILDIGTGCGLLALMAAQRSGEHCRVDAIEIDKDSFIEAGENIRDSPWKRRVRVSNQSFQSYCPIASDRFDLIITNPPYFQSGRPSPDTTRGRARHDQALSLSEIVKGSTNLLTEDGNLSLILPPDQGERFVDLAREAGLWPHRITHVYAKLTKPVERWLIEVRREVAHEQTDQLIIHNEEGSGYTPAFLAITKDFYWFA